MDKAGKPTLQARNRVSSNSNSTPRSIKRSTSTPTGSVKSRNCTFSPIVNPESTFEPKLLKPLGPGFPSTTGETKFSQFKSRPSEEQAALLYMAYQQQHFLNTMLSDAKEKVEKESKKQLEEFLALTNLKVSEVNELKKRAQLVTNHSQLRDMVSQIEPNAKKSTDILKDVIPHAQELAQGIDSYRHEIRLEDVNQLKEGDFNEITNVFENISSLCQKVDADKMDQAIKVASAISELDISASGNIKILEGCRDMSSRTITRLGQQICLADEKEDFRSLDDLDDL